MFDFQLLFRLIPETFSRRRESLRYPTLKRVGKVVLFFPLFSFLLISHWFFFLIDELLFWSYRQQKVGRVCLITGLPRSATTYLIKILAADHKNFTTFKLWELLLAPSITQKYILLFIKRLITALGFSIYSIAGYLDDRLFGNFRDFHDIGLLKPEEDEALFLWTFSSIFLLYFFPETTKLDRYLYFDDFKKDRKYSKMMRYYYRCIQKHNFVFDRKCENIYLAKNPTYLSRIDALQNELKNFKVVFLDRALEQTISSTISFNMQIYSKFATVKPGQYILIDETRGFLEHWFEKAMQFLEADNGKRSRKIDFKKFTKDLYVTIGLLYEFLEIEASVEFLKYLELEDKRSKEYKTKHQYSMKL